jgi:hypothetical protein
MINNNKPNYWEVAGIVLKNCIESKTETRKKYQ